MKYEIIKKQRIKSSNIETYYILRKKYLFYSKYVICNSFKGMFITIMGFIIIFNIPIVCLLKFYYMLISIPAWILFYKFNEQEFAKSFGSIKDAEIFRDKEVKEKLLKTTKLETDVVNTLIINKNNITIINNEISNS